MICTYKMIGFCIFLKLKVVVIIMNNICMEGLIACLCHWEGRMLRDPESTQQGVWADSSPCSLVWVVTQRDSWTKFHYTVCRHEAKQ